MPKKKGKPEQKSQRCNSIVMRQRVLCVYTISLQLRDLLSCYGSQRHRLKKRFIAVTAFEVCSLHDFAYATNKKEQEKKYKLK